MKEKFLELTKMLESVSKDISDIYDKLYEIEITHGKDNENYKTAMDILTKNIHLEEDIINTIIRLNLCEVAIKYFSEKYKKDSSFIINANSEKEDVSKIRIINNLFAKSWSKSEELKGCFMSVSEYQLSLMVDHLLLALSIVEENQSEELSSAKAKMKYNLSATIPRLETILLNNKFDISMHPYITFNMMVISHSERKEESRIVNNNMLTMIIAQIEIILMQNSEFKKNVKNYADFIFCTSCLRAAFVLMEEKTAEDIKNIILSFLDAVLYKKRCRVNFSKDFNADTILIKPLINTLIRSIESSSNSYYNTMVLKRLLNEVEKDRRIPQYVEIGR